MAARSKASVCGRSLAGFAGSNPSGGHGCLYLVSFVCCQVEVSVTSWSLVQRCPTEWGVSEYDHEASIMKRPWLTKEEAVATNIKKYHLPVRLPNCIFSYSAACSQMSGTQCLYDHVCMIQMSVWSRLYDAKVCMTPMSVWSQCLYDHSVRAQHLYDPNVCVITTSVWSRLYDPNVCMIPMPVWSQCKILISVWSQCMYDPNVSDHNVCMITVSMIPMSVRS